MKTLKEGKRKNRDYVITPNAPCSNYKRKIQDFKSFFRVWGFSNLTFPFAFSLFFVFFSTPRGWRRRRVGIKRKRVKELLRNGAAPQEIEQSNESRENLTFEMKTQERSFRKVRRNLSLLPLPTFALSRLLKPSLPISKTSEFSTISPRTSGDPGRKTEKEP